MKSIQQLFLTLLLDLFIDEFVFGSLTYRELKMWMAFFAFISYLNVYLYFKLFENSALYMAQNHNKRMEKTEDLTNESEVKNIDYTNNQPTIIPLIIPGSSPYTIGIPTSITPKKHSANTQSTSIAVEPLPGSLSSSFSSIQTSSNSSLELVPVESDDLYKVQSINSNITTFTGISDSFISIQNPINTDKTTISDPPTLLRCNYDKYQMKGFRFQHDIMRVYFKSIKKFIPFDKYEDIGLYMDVKIQKFPSKKYSLDPDQSFEFDNFLKHVEESIIPFVSLVSAPSSYKQRINSHNNDLSTEEEFVFVRPSGNRQSSYRTGCECHSFQGYYSVHVSPNLVNCQTKDSNFSAFDQNSDPFKENCKERDPLAIVTLTIAITRMRSALRGCYDQIKSLTEEISNLKSIGVKKPNYQKSLNDLERSLSVAINQRNRLTQLCCNCLMTPMFFAIFSESRNSSLTVLHFLSDMLCFGSPEVIYSQTESRDINNPKVVMPSTNIYLLKLVYDFYVLRLHQTRRAHYQSLNLNGKGSNSNFNNVNNLGGSSNSNINNSYDEPTYRYIMLLRTMLDTISVLICLKLPRGHNDLRALLQFTSSMWSQPHLSKSAKHSSVQILFVATSLIHYDLLFACHKDDKIENKPSVENAPDGENSGKDKPNAEDEEEIKFDIGPKSRLSHTELQNMRRDFESSQQDYKNSRDVLTCRNSCEDMFVELCAQALQYRVADIRLHVRRNYWLVRSIHPELHLKIQKVIKEKHLNGNNNNSNNNISGYFSNNNMNNNTNNNSNNQNRYRVGKNGNYNGGYNNNNNNSNNYYRSNFQNQYNGKKFGYSQMEQGGMNNMAQFGSGYGVNNYVGSNFKSISLNASNGYSYGQNNGGLEYGQHSKK